MKKVAFLAKQIASKSAYLSPVLRLFLYFIAVISSPAAPRPSNRKLRKSRPVSEVKHRVTGGGGGGRGREEFEWAARRRIGMHIHGLWPKWGKWQNNARISNACLTEQIVYIVAFLLTDTSS